MSTNCVWDGNSQTEQNNNDESDYNDIWEPWKNIIVSQKTATANITKLQKLARRKQQNITYDNIAEALEAKNFLRYSITIQIASNGNFVSIEFFKKEQMEQFCCEPLTIQGFSTTFYPEGHIRRKPPKRLMNVSLINIPPETPEQLVTEFLEEYADIEGTPMYVKKSHNGRKYCTGTRVYQINKLYQHIPRRLPNTFGRTIICIYDLQPEQEQYNQQRKAQPVTENRLSNKPQNNRLALAQNQMKTQTINGNNKDTTGKNKTNKKENKPTTFTTTLHKDEINTKYNNNPRI